MCSLHTQYTNLAPWFLPRIHHFQFQVASRSWGEKITENVSLVCDCLNDVHCTRYFNQIFFWIFIIYLSRRCRYGTLAHKLLFVHIYSFAAWSRNCPENDFYLFSFIYAFTAWQHALWMPALTVANVCVNSHVRCTYTSCMHRNMARTATTRRNETKSKRKRKCRQVQLHTM